jgi:hypothetical protein
LVTGAAEPGSGERRIEIQSAGIANEPDHVNVLVLALLHVLAADASAEKRP